MKIRLTEKSTFGINSLKSTKLCILLLILSLAVSLLTYAKEPSGNQEPQPTAILTDIAASQVGGTLTVTMKTNRVLEPKSFRLDNPPRLVLDFQNTENRVPFMKLPLKSEAANQLRVSQFQSTTPQIARVVFDLGEKPVGHKISLDSGSVKVTLQPEGLHSDKAAKAPEAPVQTTDKRRLQKNTSVTAEPTTPAVKSVSTKPTSVTEEKSVDVATTPVPADTDSEASETPSRPRESVAMGSKIDSKLESLPEPMNQEPSSTVMTPEPVRRTSNSEKPETASGNMPATELKPAETTVVERNTKAPALIASLEAGASSLSMAKSGGMALQNTASQNNGTSRFSGQLLTLDFVDLPLVDFFRVMSEEAGINIVLDPKVKGNISIKVEKLPWDQIFDMVLVNHSLDKQIEGNLIRVATKSTLQEEAKQRESLKQAELLAADLETRVKRLNYAKAASLMDSLKDLKTVRGTVVNDERTNSLILTDIPTSLDKMMELITTLDIPQPQVEIEARIVSAARDFARDIGIQFGFVKGNLERVTVGGPNTFGTIGGTRPSATPNSTFVAGNGLTGRGAAGDTASESGAVSTGENGNYNVNLPAAKAFGGLGISIGNIFDTFLLDAALTAGESKGLAKLISQPKVTAQNNSPAVISQGTRFPVLVRANNTTTVQFYNAALTLTVTPQITYEGNIVLDLKVENNTADWGRTVESVPSIRISESQSRVLVSDGGTTVIGGILIDEDSNSGDKVPGLGDLPLLGNLFRRTSVSRNTQEVLFFVTPHIIN